MTAAVYRWKYPSPLAGDDWMAAAPSMLVHWINVIVLARFHNPSILNPDFLTMNKIVSDDWEISETVTTRALSVVQFKNNVRISVDEERLDVRQSKLDSFPEASPIYEIASRYVGILQHVSYLALGTNWNVTLNRKEPGTWLVSRFLKPGAWVKREPRLTGCKVTLSFDADGATCNLAVSPTMVKGPEGAQEEGIEINCNFHNGGPLRPQDIQTLLRTWPKRQKFLQAQIRRLFIGRLQ